MASRPGIKLDQEYEARFDHEVRANETRRLRELSALANRRSASASNESRVQHLTIGTILSRTLQTMVDVLDDLSNGRAWDHVFWGPKGERPFYVGVVVVGMAFCIYLVDVTS